MNDQLATIDQAKSTLLDLAVRFGPKLLTAILILVAGFMVSRWAARWFGRMLARIELEPPVRLLLSRVVRFLVLLLFVIMALQNLGVELLPLIAGLGVAGAAVALATQGVLSNAAAGLTIIFTKPFRVGQYVSIVGEEGQVDSITLFNTTLSHTDHSLIVIPNRKVVGEILHNFGKIRQLTIVVGVAYDTDLNVALAAINDILRANARVLREPAPVIQTSLLGNSSVNIAVKPWVAVPDYVDASGEINKAILETFRGRGIVIPFPQHEVRLLGNKA
ncbi:MAG TPA: mechanosensitive ion channel domain-containing protein [Steroidobacteraceae bacterium]|nr:mechanosensitive ion channel domain-containing protein [Steroidobacteraceae bacterium]